MVPTCAMIRRVPTNIPFYKDFRGRCETRTHDFLLVREPSRCRAGRRCQLTERVHTASPVFSSPCVEPDWQRCRSERTPYSARRADAGDHGCTAPSACAAVADSAKACAVDRWASTSSPAHRAECRGASGWRCGCTSGTSAQVGDRDTRDRECRPSSSAAVALPEPSTKTCTEVEYRSMLAAVKARMPRVGDTRLLRPTFKTRRDAILQLLWATGLRRSELARLLVGDVDCEAQHRVVSKSKTGRPRVVPISPQATTAVLSYLRQRALHVHAGRPELWLSTRREGAHVRRRATGHRAHRSCRWRGRVGAPVSSELGREVVDRGRQPDC
jgi:hypothetical protein